MARQTFDNYLAEFRETQNAVNALTDSTHKLYGDYAYACGYFGSMISDLISQLPKHKRAEYRQTLLQKAKGFEQERLMNTIKETV